MFDLKITSNGHILTRELQGWAANYSSYQNRQVRLVAQEFVKDCIKEIDDIIYSTPAGEDYKRTKVLRKGHKLRKVGDGFYVVGNYAPYAIFQHDGWRDRGGVWHAGRPWMDIAAHKNEAKYAQMLDKTILDMWGK